MRRSWDEPADEGLDEPVTLTTRQLRSLKLGARAGVFALVLAIAAAGLAGWNTIQGSKQKSEQARTAENGLAQAAVASPSGAPSTLVADASTPAVGAPVAQPAVAVAQAQATKPAPKATAPTVARTTRSSSSSALPPPPKRKSATARAPVTESFAPSGAAPAPSPTPSPMPITFEPSKPVVQDSSGAHH